MTDNPPLAVETAKQSVQRRAARAANAIVALENTYEREPVIFFKTLDNILIGLGSPLGLRVTIDNEPGGFDSISGAEPIGTKHHPFGGKLAFQILKRHGPGDPQTMSLEGSELLSQLANIMLTQEGPDLLARLLNVLCIGFKSVRGATFSEPASVEASPIGESEDRARQQLKDVFDGLDAFLVGGNHRFAFPWSGGECPRFLFFHKYLGQNGQPTVRLNLLNSQRTWLRQHFGQEALTEFELDASRSFDMQRWAIGDSLLRGTSGWASWPWSEGVANSQNVPARKLVTSLAFGRPLSDLRPEQEVSPSLLTPIHVDGLPWLAMAGVLSNDESGRLIWAQDFYRDLLPYVTTTIRGLAERAYLSAVRRTARETIERGSAALTDLTGALSALTATFPYKKVLLSHTQQHERDHPFEWRNDIVYLRSADFGTDTSRVEYARLQRSGVAAAIEQGERDAHVAMTEQLEARLMSYVNIGHSLKNIVTCTGWAAAAAAVGTMNNYFDQMVAEGFTESDLEDLRRALGYGDRSLSLFWIVESLGHFIRLAGARTGNFEWTKFSDWVDAAVPMPPAKESFLESYINATFTLTTSIAYGMGWKRICVSSNEENSVRRWTGEPPQPVDIKSLHIPPFKKGCDGGYIFAFLLLEPVVNAIHALDGLPDCYRSGTEEAWLDIEVSPDDTREGVLIKVSNLSANPLPETLSGLESTKAIAEELGIGSFDEPVTVPIAKNLYHITTRMHFDAGPTVQAIFDAECRHE